jgi:hypothetical protein
MPAMSCTHDPLSSTYGPHTSYLGLPQPTAYIQVRTEQELASALGSATSPEHEQDCCFIEVLLDRDDVSKEVSQ